jgi:predicted ATPase/class 3 adenylate cyclase
MTDIVGSTALLHRYPADIMAALDLHDKTLHAAIRRHHGDPFKSTGDGVVAIFERPLDAIQAAIEAQRKMRSAKWGPMGRLKVRYGIHSGVARARGADYFGPALAIAARLQGAANADQILISHHTAEAMASEDAAALFELDHLGEHHFKGVEAIRVLQVCAQGLPRTFAPIGGKRETADGNLPANLNSFLGREREIGEIVELTRDARLITLVGPGGIGKTRLAIELARSVETSFPDGAWMVDLTALERGSDVWPTIGEALLIQPLPAVEWRTLVTDRLRTARALLLMDNCEHVLDQIAEVAEELGATCRTLFMLNTSRRALGVDGEAIYEVSALAPESNEAPDQSAAVRLFVERGRFAYARFQPTPGDLQTIQRLCADLEYIPLAIEIAARNLRRLSVDEVAAGLTSPLDLHGPKTQRHGGRQQTLRHTLEWSYNLLDTNSQHVLQQLSVFSGPFREDQAIAVCAPDTPSRAKTIEGIDELVESSLLYRDSGRGQLLRMLQTVQAFGREKLAEANRLETLERRHAEVFAARCLELAAQFASDKEAKAANAIYDDTANLRSAFDRTLARDLELAAAIAAPLFLFNYWHRGAETGGWYQRIMARSGADQLSQAPILLAGAACHALHSEGNPKKAAAFIERGYQAEKAGAESSRGWLSSVAGQIALWAGRASESQADYLRAIDEAHRAGDFACEMVSLCTAAFVMARIGDLEGAGHLVETIIRTGQNANQPSLVGYVHYAIGGVEGVRDVEKAVRAYQLSAEWATMGGNNLGAQRVKHLIADLLAARATPTEAVRIHVKTLSELPPHGATFYVWSTIRTLLSPLAELRSDENIAVLAGALRASPVKLDKNARAAIEAARKRLGDLAFDAGQARGAAMDLGQTRSYISRALGEAGAAPSATVISAI